jgi:hypothetical protein
MHTADALNSAMAATTLPIVIPQGSYFRLEFNLEILLKSKTVLFWLKHLRVASVSRRHWARLSAFSSHQEITTWSHMSREYLTNYFGKLYNTL